MPYHSSSSSFWKAAKMYYIDTVTEVNSFFLLVCSHFQSLFHSHFFFSNSLLSLSFVTRIVIRSKCLIFSLLSVRRRRRPALTEMKERQFSFFFFLYYYAWSCFYCCCCCCRLLRVFFSIFYFFSFWCCSSFLKMKKERKKESSLLFVANEWRNAGYYYYDDDLVWFGSVRFGCFPSLSFFWS